MEYELGISEESAEKLHKLFDAKFEELKEAHNRFENGTETLEDLLEHYKHYRMDVETKKDSIKLDLIELKYYEKLVSIVKKQDNVINEMAEQLSGLTILDIKKDEYIVLGDKEEVKEYFEKKAEEKENG